MKKIISTILSSALLMSMSVTAFAADTQTVSVSIPDYKYTLTIPDSCSIEYNNTNRQSLGYVTVTIEDGNLFESNKMCVQVTAKANNYLENAQGARIECKIGDVDPDSNNEVMGLPWDGWLYAPYRTASKEMAIRVDDWSEAIPGTTYSTTITYGAYTRKWLNY